MLTVRDTRTVRIRQLYCSQVRFRGGANILLHLASEFLRAHLQYRCAVQEVREERTYGIGYAGSLGHVP